MRQLDTEAYADTVKKRRQQGRADKRASLQTPVTLEEKFKAEQCAHKKSNRAHKRKLNKVCKQLKRLRQQNRSLKTQNRLLKEENRRLKATIAKLNNGDHDIELDGSVQTDMISVLQECRKSPMLETELTKQDPTGTLYSVLCMPYCKYPPEP